MLTLAVASVVGAAAPAVCVPAAPDAAWAPPP